MIKKLFSALGGVLKAFLDTKIKLKYVIIAVVVIAGAAVAYTASTIIRNVGGDADYEEAKRYIQIKDILEENYINTVDRTSMGDSAAYAMVAGLRDQWSYYMSAAEYKTYLLSSSAEYSDLGLSLMRDEAGRGFQVLSVNTASPSGLAGVTVGMIINSVDGQDITELDTDAVRTLIRSKLNAKFVLGVVNQDSITVDCTAAYVSPVSYRFEKTEAGYVKIDNFEAGSGTDAVNAIEELLKQKPSSLVLDLRGNPGGLMSELEILMDYLLPSCDLFITVDKGGHEEVTTSDSVCIQLPMCVLINSETYGAAEVCAAVLQEYQWATLMGEPTLGQTRTQETIELDDGSAIRLSTRTILTPNRKDIALNGGVIPDMIVYNSDASATGTTEGTTGASDGSSGISNDDQLNAALKFLS